MSEVGVISNNSMLMDMQKMKLSAQNQMATKSSNGIYTSFGDALKGVDEAQKVATATKVGFLSGDPSISMADVMMKSQKAEIALETTKLVKNKLLETFKELSNTQI